MQAVAEPETHTATVAPEVQALVDLAAAVQETGPGASPRVAQLRRDGREAFARQGFPTLRQEEWRFTNVKPIANGGFEPVPASVLGALPEVAPGVIELIDRYRFDGGLHLVFVDGHFRPELLVPADLPEGVTVLPLAEAIQQGAEGVEAHLGRYANVDDSPFTALNTAFLASAGAGGAFVHARRNVLVEVPIQVIFVAVTPGSVSFPRNLFVADEGAQVTVVETYIGMEGPAGESEHVFTNPVTEAVCGPNAFLDHYKVQREPRHAFHVATQQSYSDRAAVFRSHNISLGGKLVRNDLNGYLDGEGGDCTLNGLYLVDGRQHVDNHMKVDHAKPHCTSHELYKGILDGHGRAVFNGLIHVHKDAQKTDAKQTNRNLLLSPNALANSNPQLEIFADDVRCTHGSTVGQLDEEAIFYLRSRGISAEAASSLLTYAFASELVERIRVDAVRQDLEEFLFSRLPGGEIVRQAV